MKLLKVSEINCESYSNLAWKFFLVAGTVANQLATFAITYTKLYVPVVSLSIQDDAKLLEQLKSGFKKNN